MDNKKKIYDLLESAKFGIFAILLTSISSLTDSNKFILYFQISIVLSISLSILDRYSKSLSNRRTIGGYRKLPYYKIPFKFLTDIAIIITIAIPNIVLYKRMDFVSHISLIAGLIFLAIGLNQKEIVTIPEISFKEGKKEVSCKNCNNFEYEKNGKKYKVIVKELKQPPPSL